MKTRGKMGNRIAAIRTHSKLISKPHLLITVDGVPLDELLDAALPGRNLAGLIPSLLGWFDNDEDNAVPWQRVLPEVGCTGYAPILICPDDLDYFCTVVMAEVVAEPDWCPDSTAEPQKASVWQNLLFSALDSTPWRPGLAATSSGRRRHRTLRTLEES